MSSKHPQKKAFGLISAIFLGVGSMVGAGIFVLLGESGNIAGNLVYISFILGGIIALLSGYSFSKLAIRYPSRGGLVEYLTQCYREGIFSGSISILFYLSAMIAVSMVAKTFGTYASTLIIGSYSLFWTDIYAVSILLILSGINFFGSMMTTKFENVLVVSKLVVLVVFTFIIFRFIKPALLSNSLSLPLSMAFYAIGLTFFAYEGFRVITNTVEDIENPKKNIFRAMFISIILVMVLYVSISIAIFGTLPLNEIAHAKDYVLAVAAKSSFGMYGFMIMAITALVSTASAINASLYSITNVTYTMAKKGELPKEYSYNLWNNSEGLIISLVFLIFFTLFFDLTQIAIIGSISILMVHSLVHIGHLFKIRETKASKILVMLAVLSTASAIVLALVYTSRAMPNIIYYIIAAFILSFVVEILFRLTTKRVIKRQFHFSIF